MQLEIETDELLKLDSVEVQRQKAWKLINGNMKTLCMEIYEQAEWTMRILMEMRQDQLEVQCWREPRASAKPCDKNPKGGRQR